MKPGTENRTKVFIAIALGAVAVIVIATQLGGWFTASSSSAATPSAPRAVEVSADPVPAVRNSTRPHAATGNASSIRSLDPTLRFDLLRASEETKYEGTGRNIFRVFVEIPQPKVPVVTDHQTTVASSQGPAQPPPPPPINLVFYGFATPVSGSKRIFLAQGEDVFIAKEGDIVDRRYKVVRISVNAVEILDVLSNNRQSIPLTQG